MKTYRIPQTDLEVSRLAYGCGALASMGRPKPPTVEDGEEAIAKFKVAHSPELIEKFQREPLNAEVVANAERMIHTACDAGITLFDHADIYGFGKAEEAFGEALKRSPGLRNRLVIQTKCGIVFARDRYRPARGDPHRIDLSGKHIMAAAEGSLRRLGTDHIDIFLLHRPDALVEPAEVAEAFDRLHGTGKVRYFGVSNHTPAQIDLLKSCVRQPLVVNQIQLGLAHSYLVADGIEANREDSSRITQGYAGVGGTLDYCRLNRIQVQAWAPLKGGNILNPPNLLGAGENASREVQEAAQVLAEIARRKDTTPGAIALAWLLRHPAGIVPIIGSTRVQHVLEACGADSVLLTREEWYELFTAAAGVPSLSILGLVLPKGF